MADDRILVGVVIGAHGLRGEVKVKTFTEDPASLGAYGALATRKGREFRVAGLRVGAEHVIARFEGITGRDAAEALKGEELFVPRAALPEPGEEEYYHADLLGLAAEDEAGRALGTVTAVHDFGAGDMIEIAGADGAAILLPFTRARVPAIDIAAGRITVVPQSGEDVP